MKRLAVLCLLLVAGNAVLAHQATEVYIPIGKSPGISLDNSIVGSISSVDHERYQMAISAAGGTRNITMTPATRYYIDRSGEKKQSRTGDFEDCEVGLRIEAYVDAAGNAVWVKIVP